MTPPPLISNPSTSTKRPMATFSPVRSKATACEVRSRQSAASLQVTDFAPLRAAKLEASTTWRIFSRRAATRAEPILRT